MKTFERMLVSEDADIQEIVQGILLAQARFAKAQHRPLERGTHAKGLCVRGTFEVFDPATTIADPVLRARLAHGLFSKPGKYPATIRFANAASTSLPDYKPDVRAVSFAVSVPSGGPGSGAIRHDFSMNNAPTFPINDAHTFATLMRVKQAGSVWKTIKALTTLSPGEWVGLIKTGILAKRQMRDSVRPYERMRFWSNVPFRHGPNEAIKYSATPGQSNPASDPPRSADMLRDDLVRHLETGEGRIEFDFAIQLLDADRMRHSGRQRDDIYWVENASVEWPEDQAPFHTVGRLVLGQGSPLSEEECREFYIDVTEHSTIDSHPLGSINRARWFAESASHRARLGVTEKGAAAGVAIVRPSAIPDARIGAPLPAPAIPRGTWIGSITLHTIAKAAGIMLIAGVVVSTAFAIGTMAYVEGHGGMLPVERVESVTYADNGFGAGLNAPRRQTFYYTPQGAGLKDIRYSWFVNLEMPWGRQRVSDLAVLSRYGFLVDAKTPRNPDGLPVGFTKHFDAAMSEELLDVTCAACHTGQVQVTKQNRTRALRIDGGQADHAFTDATFGNFMPTLIASMIATETNPIKFNRFARSVLGAGYPEGKWALRRELLKVIITFGGVAWNEKTRHLSPTAEGYGRLDALGRMGNTVFAENLGVPKNYAVGDAPVSYPSLWNIWKFDWVQYNASVSQPMARNIAEAMGVGAKYALVDQYGSPLPPAERFPSTARIESLDTIEHTLRTLKPPAWDTTILGPVSMALAEKGKALFNQHCVGCHGPHIADSATKALYAPGKKNEPMWLVATLCTNDIGTDPNAAHDFATREVDITRTGMTAAELRSVARNTEDKWNTRRSAYLNGEIRRLRPFGDADSVAKRVKFEKDLAGLGANTEQMLAQIDPAHLPLGQALSYLGTMIRQKAYEDGRYTDARKAELDGFGALDMPQGLDMYKARPLAGVWATPPFLHNGSVPTIYDLLSPPSERPKTFQVGSHEFDPVHLGLAPVTNFRTFDTKLSGNHNTGHEFGPGYDPKAHGNQARPGLIGPLLTEDEKMAIIEHLKVRDDDLNAPTKPIQFPVCRGGY
jgi:hypothetical protein